MDGRESQVFRGPYRATKLWNGIVNSFRAQIPLSRHRRHVRFHDNCFVACDAVDWLNDYLNRDPNFAFNVTRDQTVQLLAKFLKSRVFEDVRTSSSSSLATKTYQFKDNRDLYRFPRKSPVKVTVGRSPLATRTNTNVAVVDTKKGCVVGKTLPVRKDDLRPKLAECRVTVTRRQPTVEQIETTWKEALHSRLRQLWIDLENVDHLLSGLEGNPKYIIHNSTRIGRSGVVDGLDRSKELPHWILSAMKCLVAWPKASGMESCLPNYPGFEKDVFRVVHDYFRNLDEPLTTFVMYEVLVSIYDFSEKLDSGLNRPATASSFVSRPVDDLVDRLSRASVIEAEPGMQKTSTPIGNGLGQSCPNLSKLKQKCTSLMACSSEMVLPSVCFETVFLTENPVTRIITAPKEDFLQVGPRSGSAVCLRNQANGLNVEMKSPRCKSVASLPVACDRNVGHPHVREGKVIDVKTFAQRSFRKSQLKLSEESNVLNVLLNESGGYLNLAYNENLDCVPSVEPQLSCSGGYVNLACTDLTRCSDENDELGRPLSNVFEESESTYHSTCSQPSQDFESSCFAEGNRPLCRSISSSSPMLETKSKTDEVQYFSRTDYQSLGSQGNGWTWNPSDACLRRLDSTPSEVFNTKESKSFAIEAMQLCLLLLPPDTRRNLHRLLRFMAKVVNNKHLTLDPGQSNRSLILNTFSRSLLCPKYEADYNELVANRIVAFFLDQYEAILGAPSWLVARVESSFASFKDTKIRYTGADCDDDLVDCTALTYCKQVTAEEYERQKCSASENAIADLLDNIVIDPNISAQEKKKRLKQFKKVYPEIYGRKFPNESVKKKQATLYKKPLQKLLEMRL